MSFLSSHHLDDFSLLDADGEEIMSPPSSTLPLELLSHSSYLTLSIILSSESSPRPTLSLTSLLSSPTPPPSFPMSFTESIYKISREPMRTLCNDTYPTFVLTILVISVILPINIVILFLSVSHVVCLWLHMMCQSVYLLSTSTATTRSCPFHPSTTTQPLPSSPSLQFNRYLSMYIIIIKLYSF